MKISTVLGLLCISLLLVAEIKSTPHPKIHSSNGKPLVNVSDFISDPNAAIAELVKIARKISAHAGKPANHPKGHHPKGHHPKGHHAKIHVSAKPTDLATKPTTEVGHLAARPDNKDTLHKNPKPTARPARPTPRPARPTGGNARPTARPARPTSNANNRHTSPSHQHPRPAAKPTTKVGHLSARPDKKATPHRNFKPKPAHVRPTNAGNVKPTGHSSRGPSSRPSYRHPHPRTQKPAAKAPESAQKED